MRANFSLLCSMFNIFFQVFGLPNLFVFFSVQITVFEEFSPQTIVRHLLMSKSIYEMFVSLKVIVKLNFIKVCTHFHRIIIGFQFVNHFAWRLKCYKIWLFELSNRFLHLKRNYENLQRFFFGLLRELFLNAKLWRNTFIFTLGRHLGYFKDSNVHWMCFKIASNEQLTFLTRRNVTLQHFLIFPDSTANFFFKLIFSFNWTFWLNLRFF